MTQRLNTRNRRLRTQKLVPEDVVLAFGIISVAYGNDLGLPISSSG